MASATDSIAPYVSGASGLLGSVVGAVSTAIANKKQKQFAVDMYNRQRADALTDWNRQNQYDSPAAQMSRFQAAGLNPNLIYGKGDSGNAGAIRSSSPGSYNPQPVRFDPSNAVDNYYDTKIKQAQLNATLKATEVAESNRQLNSQTVLNKIEEMLNLREERPLIGYRGQLLQQEYGQKETMFPYQTQAADLQNERIRQGLRIAAEQNARDALKSGNDALESQLRQKQMEQELEHNPQVWLRRDMEIRDLKERIYKESTLNEWLDKGVTPSDPLWERQVLLNRPKSEDPSDPWGVQPRNWFKLEPGGPLDKLYNSAIPDMRYNPQDAIRYRYNH